MRDDLRDGQGSHHGYLEMDQSRARAHTTYSVTVVMAWTAFQHGRGQEGTCTKLIKCNLDMWNGCSSSPAFLVTLDFCARVVLEVVSKPICK